jgi:hypothetical protein
MTDPGRAQRTRPLDGCPEIFDLEPQEDAVAVGFAGRVAHVRVLVGVPVMELKNEPVALVDEPLVLGAAMTASAAQQARGASPP